MAVAAAVLVAAAVAAQLSTGASTDEVTTVVPGRLEGAAPPAWFGEPRAAYREPDHSGRWVSTTIGRVSAGAVADPVVAAVFDGTSTALDRAEPTVVDGVALRAARYGDALVLATDGTPTVMVSGPDDEALLAAVLGAVDVTDPDGDFTLRLASLPDGYSEVVAPQALPAGAEMGETLADDSGDTAIDRRSGWADPLLAPASNGADLTAVDLGGSTGWLATTTTEAQTTLTSLRWSPRRGTMLEITTQDTARTVDDLAALARWASDLDQHGWDTYHRG